MEAVRAEQYDASEQSRSIASRVASNLSWSVASEAVGKSTFFITNIYLARTLGVESFGLFTLSMALTYYFWRAVDLGTSMYGIREIAKDKENAVEVINPLLTMRLTAGVVVFSIYFAVLILIELSMQKRLVFAGCGIYLLSYAFYTDWILKGLEKFKFIAYGSLVSSLVFFVLVLGFVHGSDDVAVAAIAWSTSYFLGSVSLFYFLYRKLCIKYTPSFNFKIWINHLRESVYFAITGSLVVIYQYLPILLLSIFYTTYEVALFAAPYTVVMTIVGAAFMIPMAYYPVVSDIFVQDKGQFKKAHRKFQMLMLGLGLPVAVVGSIFADNIVQTLFGNQYNESIDIFRILIWLIPLIFFRETYGVILLAINLQKKVPIGIVAASLTVLFISILFKNELDILMPLIIIFGEICLLVSYMIIMNYRAESCKKNS